MNTFSKVVLAMVVLSLVAPVAYATQNGGNKYSANVYVADFYPQGYDYMFYCEVEDFEPTTWNWKFGDGSKLVGMQTDRAYHIFPEEGMYEVKCVAKDDEGNKAKGKVKVTVQEPVDVPEFGGLFTMAAVSTAAVGLVAFRRKQEE